MCASHVAILIALVENLWPAAPEQNIQLMRGVWHNAEMSDFKQSHNKLARIDLVFAEIAKYGPNVIGEDGLSMRWRYKAAHRDQVTIEAGVEMRRAWTRAIADCVQIVFQFALLVEVERAGEYGELLE